MISVFYNLKIFSITMESPHIFEALWHRLTEFIKKPDLPATIRKTFHDLPRGHKRRVLPQFYPDIQ
jgi:hypothetical protein